MTILYRLDHPIGPFRGKLVVGTRHLPRFMILHESIRDHKGAGHFCVPSNFAVLQL